MAFQTSLVAAHSGKLELRTFNRLAELIYEYSGIKMPPSKVTMLEGRLRRRLRATGIASFDDYCEFLFNRGGDSELIQFINVVTTNKTDFFREPQHFEILIKDVLPDLVRQGHSQIRAWSSACSTGAEPYTMAIVLEEALLARTISDYSILATDLCTDVLSQAMRGVYTQDFVEPVPQHLATKYLMSPKQADRPEVRVSPKLRKRIAFARLNLMDEAYRLGEPVNLIFCRNVLIYFDRDTQQKVLKRLCDCLAPGGYLFIGHSESTKGMGLPLHQIANTVFQKV